MREEIGKYRQAMGREVKGGEGKENRQQNRVPTTTRQAKLQPHKHSANRTRATQQCSAPRSKYKWKRTASENGGRHSDGLHVGDGGGAAEQADVGGERGFHARLPLTTLETLNQCGLLTADVGTYGTV
jgi:hypothetical protein